MNKIEKICCLIAILLLLFLMFSVVVSYQLSVDLPWRFLSFDDYPFLEDWLPKIALYLAVFCMLLLLVLSIITVFFPKKISAFTLQKATGSMKISKKAIENLITESLRTEKLMRAPDVSVKMSKKKLTIKVKGEIPRTSDLYGQTDIWSQQLEEQLHQFISPTLKINIRILFNKLQSASKSRVS